MLRLRDIMTTEVLTVTPDTSLRTAMELFAAHHISGAPVMSGRRVIGVLSASDILSFATTDPGTRAQPAAVPDEGLAEEPELWDGDTDPPAHYFAGKWREATGEAEPGDEPDAEPARAEWDRLGESTVSDAMTWGVYALPPDYDVSLAAACMRSADVHRLLVMEEGTLEGIVTTMDLVRAVSEHRLVRRRSELPKPHD